MLEWPTAAGWILQHGIEAHTGGSACGAVQVEHFDFAPGLGDRISAAALVISHAGSGSLFEALGAALLVPGNPRTMH